MRPISPTKPALVLFCRRPQPGVGKQRIAAQLGAEFAAALGDRLLAAALEDAASWPGPVVIAPAEADDAAWAGRLLARPARVLAQPAGNLGERLAAIDRQLRAAGHGELLFIGSDAPGLTPDLYARARAALDDADAVLAGARDGGVTLMGSVRPWPALEDLPWSTPALGRALLARLVAAGWTVRQLDGGQDVDEAADLPAVVTGLETDMRPARRALRAWLLAQGIGATGFPSAGAAGPPDAGAGIAAPARTSATGAADDPAAATGPVAGGPASVGGLSVVIPVYRDNAALAGLLARLGAGAGPVAIEEVIVVDGAGDPACQRLCEQAGARWLATPAGRGHQLDAGARLARGELLWFLHADAEPPADGPLLVTRALSRPGVVGGWFRFRFAGPARWPRRLLAALINWRTRFGVAYGDQGLFMRRADYLAAGGFAEQPLFEEVPLLRALRQRGRLVPLGATIGVSARRWERDGWLRRSLINRALALAYMLGVPPARLAAWYGHHRQADS